MLLELATIEWKKMSSEEQTAWLSRPKTSYASVPPPPKSQLSSSSQKKSNFVQQEIFKRTYKTGLDRQTAREEFYGNLLWREKDLLDDLMNRRWGIVVLSSDGEDMANEIISLCVEKGKVVAEMRIFRPEAIRQPRLHQLDCLYDKLEDVNTACIRMNRFFAGCCYNYILTPANQLAELADILQQMKQMRDKLHDRDTQSIRLDRIISLEDAVMMLRKLRNSSVDSMEFDQKWEQLMAEWDKKSTVDFARAVADYFLHSLDESQEKEVKEMGEEEKQEKEKESWLTFSLERIHCSDQATESSHFVYGPVSLLPPPNHISPRCRRLFVPRRWRDSARVDDRPNPFNFPPQMAQDSKQASIQFVSRWLEAISLDNQAPIEEENSFPHVH